MKTSIATVCLSGRLEQKLRAAAEAGFDGVELFELDLVVSDLGVDEVAAMARRLGLTLDLYQPFRDLEGVTEAEFVDNLRRLDDKLALMQRLGIDLVLVCSNVATASVHDDAVIADQLRRAGDVAAARGVRIAYEALAWGTHVNTYRHAWELVRAADHPAVGVCLDSFHILARGDDPTGIAEIPGEKILFVQLADAPELDMAVLPWSRHHRVFPGEGSFALTDFVAQVVRAGYTGPLSLEIFNDVFREADPRETAVDGMRSLVWLQQRVRGALGADSAEAAGLTGVPKLEPVETVDHLELATDRPAELGGLLTALGFTFQGQHRRSPAQLFTAGPARVVISPVAAGGTRLASVAVRVPDAEQAHRRALRLGAAHVPRPTPAGETRLPGVVAPSGWQLVFVDETSAGWPAEFGADLDLVETSLRIDHLNQVETRTRVDAAGLFLESMLRLEPGADTDVPSLRGLVRSRAYLSPAAGVRWVLNQVPPSAEQSGHPAGHVAFATDDVEAAARAMQTLGLSPLRLPVNYYDDLRARFGLDEDTLTRYRELGLLYDRDADGEIVHTYTHDLGGFFLELVQRTGGYRAFDAAGAPVRMAAQADPERTPSGPGR